MANISNRPNRQGNTLEEIIEIVSEGSMHNYVWVSKNYSQADLIRDLNAVSLKRLHIIKQMEERGDQMRRDMESNDGTLNGMNLLT